MQQGIVLSIALPLSLAFIMFGLGLHLRISDFKAVLFQPKAITIGLITQLLLLPAMCFGIAHFFDLSSALAVGLVLLAASPGGSTANIFSHLFKGDVALNISLTAINSLLAIVTIPVLINLALVTFMGEGQYVPLQFKKVAEVIVLVLVPVFLGMLTLSKAPRFAQSVEKLVKVFSALILVLLIVLIMMREKAHLLSYFEQVGVAVLVFNLISLFIGYGVGKIARLPEGQNRAIAFEVGIHNSALSLYLAVVVLANSEMAIPAAVYSLVMYMTALTFGWFLNRPGRARI